MWFYINQSSVRHTVFYYIYRLNVKVNSGNLLLRLCTPYDVQLLDSLNQNHLPQKSSLLDGVFLISYLMSLHHLNH